MIGVAVVVLAGLGVWIVRSYRPSPAPAPPATPEPAAAEPQPAPSQAEASVETLPADVDDARVRSLLGEVSANDLFRRGVAQEDLVRRWVLATDNVAEGVSPRKPLAFLAPDRPFSAAAKAGALVIAPESYARYDAVADAVASIDARALARVYRALRPALEAAYRALGYPGARVDAVTARALDRIVAAPVPDGDVAVRDEGGVFVFADPRLERLPEVEKHLLRMGPRNGRKIQVKAREIREALDLHAVAGGAGR